MVGPDALEKDDQRKRHLAGPVAPVHRHDVGARQLPIRGSSSTVAVPMQKQQRGLGRRRCRVGRTAEAGRGGDERWARRG